MTFEPGSGVLGKMHLRFENGLEAFLPNVSLEEAKAAHDLIYSRVAGLYEWRTGEGIGLTGLEYGCRKGFVDTLGSAAESTSTEDHERVVLNPTLKDTNLGWSAIATDIRARYPKALTNGIAAQMQKQGLSPDTIKNVQALVLRAFGPIAELGWKIVDVPLEMSIENSSVVFTRSDSEAQVSTGS